MNESTELASTRSSILGERGKLARNWIMFGMIAGVIGDIAYFLAVAPLKLPLQLVLVFGFAFGPLLSLAFVGFYHFFKLHKMSVAIQAGVIFGVIAGTIVNMMLVVQSAVQLTVPRDARAGLGLAWEGLRGSLPSCSPLGHCRAGI